MEVDRVLGRAAENTARLVLFDDDAVSLHRDGEQIVRMNFEVATNFHRNHHASVSVKRSGDKRVFHFVLLFLDKIPDTTRFFGFFIIASHPPFVNTFLQKKGSFVSIGPIFFFIPMIN